LARPPALSVDALLDVRKKARRVLDFVEDDRRAMKVEELQSSRELRGRRAGVG
jgi:hypothetical protein